MFPHTPNQSPPLITLTPRARLPLILLHNIITSHHTILGPPQHIPQPIIPRVRQLQRLELGLVAYPRVAARIQ